MREGKVRICLCLRRDDPSASADPCSLAKRDARGCFQVTIQNPLGVGSEYQLQKMITLKADGNMLYY